MLIVTAAAYNKLSARTKAELLNAVFAQEFVPQPSSDEINLQDFDWTNRVSLSPGEVEEFIDGGSSLYDGTKMALKLIAEYGPVVHASLMYEKLKNEDGEDYFDDLATFQRSTTRRVRSVTGGPNDYFLAWDKWSDGEGHYAVTPETHRSLKIYFKLI